METKICVGSLIIMAVVCFLIRSQPWWVRVLEQAARRPPGAGVEAQTACDHTQHLSSTLKNRRPNLNLSGLSRPVPGLAIRDSETS